MCRFHESFFVDLLVSLATNVMLRAIGCCYNCTLVEDGIGNKSIGKHLVLCVVVSAGPSHALTIVLGCARESVRRGVARVVRCYVTAKAGIEEHIQAEVFPTQGGVECAKEVGQHRAHFFNSSTTLIVNRTIVVAVTDDRFARFLVGLYPRVRHKHTIVRAYFGNGCDAVVTVGCRAIQIDVRGNIGT